MRRLLVVSHETVNLGPQGKHRGFNSLHSHFIGTAEHWRVPLAVNQSLKSCGGSIPSRTTRKSKHGYARFACDRGYGLGHV